MKHTFNSLSFREHCAIGTEMARPTKHTVPLGGFSRGETGVYKNLLSPSGPLEMQSAVLARTPVASCGLSSEGDLLIRRFPAANVGPVILFLGLQDYLTSCSTYCTTLTTKFPKRSYLASKERGRDLLHRNVSSALTMQRSETHRSKTSGAAENSWCLARFLSQRCLHPSLPSSKAPSCIQSNSTTLIR